MKRKFIINPYSGYALNTAAIAELERLFTQKTGAFDYAVAESREAAVRITRESLRQAVDQIVAVGGDGTINAAVNGFFEGGRPIRPETSVSVANVGTGSDYFKSVVAGTPVRDWKELVLDHVVRPVDVGRIRYADPDCHDRYFVNMASLGMVAEVVRKKNRGPGWVPPRLRYLTLTVGTLLSYGPKRVEIEVDGESSDLEVLAISISKGIYAGGGMRFGGGVTLSDGLFDITLFEAMNPVEMLIKMRKLYTGAFEGERAIRKIKARRISIRAPSPIPVEFDGEVYGTTDVEVSVEPKSLRLCFPKDSA